MVRLVPMTPEQFREYSVRELATYVAEQVRARHWEPAAALERSTTELEKLRPNGLETPGHRLCVIVDDASGIRVGETWYGVRTEGGHPEMYVFWIGIDPEHRRRGYATATLRRIEEEARQQGIPRLGLNVFSHNHGAYALYVRLGFEPVATSMSKEVLPNRAAGTGIGAGTG